MRMPKDHAAAAAACVVLAIASSETVINYHAGRQAIGTEAIHQPSKQGMLTHQPLPNGGSRIACPLASRSSAEVNWNCTRWPPHTPAPGSIRISESTRKRPSGGNVITFCRRQAGTSTTWMAGAGAVCQAGTSTNWMAGAGAVCQAGTSTSWMAGAGAVCQDRPVL